jgi:hypothetical protein
MWWTWIWAGKSQNWLYCAEGVEGRAGQSVLLERGYGLVHC